MAELDPDDHWAEQISRPLRDPRVMAELAQKISVLSPRRTVNEVIEQHGCLDVLVNNAGITIDKRVLKMTDEDWYKVLAVTLRWG